MPQAFERGLRLPDHALDTFAGRRYILDSPGNLASEQRQWLQVSGVLEMAEFNDVLSSRFFIPGASGSLSRVFLRLPRDASRR